MNPIMENILTRRSIRKFQKKEIPQEVLEQVIQAGLYAPSGMNRQTWKFTVVTNREEIQRLAVVIGEKLGRDGYDMYQPEVLIVPSNEESSSHGKEDNACALENIFLAAHSFGIGSVWINQIRTICQEPKIRQILRDWEIPDDHVIYGMAALGYADEAEPREVKKIGKVHMVR